MRETRNQKFLNSIGYAMASLAKKTSTKQLHWKTWLSKCLKDTMALFLLMVKLALAKHTLWKVTSTKLMIVVFQQQKYSQETMKELFPDQFNCCSILLNKSPILVENGSQFIVVIYKFIKKKFSTYLINLTWNGW